MRQAVDVFDGYGSRQLLEQRLNAWLTEKPRDILGVHATELRLFIHWRPSLDNQPRSAVFVKLFKTLPNGTGPDAQFAEFFNEHPNALVVHRTGNDSFLFWFWHDETD
jgi:hypothetical protein